MDGAGGRAVAWTPLSKRRRQPPAGWLAGCLVRWKKSLPLSAHGYIGASFTMDQQASQRWLETLKNEARTKSQWEHKYLTAEQKQREQEEQDAAYAELQAAAAVTRKKTLSERDAMELRLACFDDEAEASPSKRILPDHQAMRARVAAEVAASRQRSHRYTGDLSTDSMLKDIGPQLWTSMNPSYAPIKAESSQHRAHAYVKGQGWDDKVDKTFHLKQDDFMAHADKCLQLGELPFKSGGMKLSKS